MMPNRTARERVEEARQAVISALSEHTAYIRANSADLGQPHTFIAALDALVAEVREEDAVIASNPYGDSVAASGSDQPFAVGRKIAAAIRAKR